MTDDTTKGSACPSCASPDVVEFLYGEPDTEGQAMIDRGERATGGCMVGPQNPAWRCNACLHEFGRLADVHPGMFEGRSAAK
jgi:hypothetical protein